MSDTVPRPWEAERPPPQNPPLPYHMASVGIPPGSTPSTGVCRGQISDSCYQNIVELFAKRFVDTSQGIRSFVYLTLPQIYHDLRQVPPSSRRCLCVRLYLFLSIYPDPPLFPASPSQQVQHQHSAGSFAYRSSNLLFGATHRICLTTRIRCYDRHLKTT